MRYIKMTTMMVVLAAAGMLSLKEAGARSVYVKETIVQHGGPGMHPGRGYGYGHGHGHGHGWGRGNYRSAYYCPPRYRGYYGPAYYRPAYGGHRHHYGDRSGGYISVRF